MCADFGPGGELLSRERADVIAHCCLGVSLAGEAQDQMPLEFFATTLRIHTRSAEERMLTVEMRSPGPQVSTTVEGSQLIVETGAREAKPILEHVCCQCNGRPVPFFDRSRHKRLQKAQRGDHQHPATAKTGPARHLSPDVKRAARDLEVSQKSVQYCEPPSSVLNGPVGSRVSYAPPVARSPCHGCPLFNSDVHGVCRPTRQREVETWVIERVSNVDSCRTTCSQHARMDVV